QGEWGLFSTTVLERDIEIVQLNVLAMMSMTKLYLQDMLLRDSGKILNVGSDVARTPTAYLAVYGATKAFVLSFTESLIAELKHSSVAVSCLLPSPTDTDFYYKAR